MGSAMWYDSFVTSCLFPVVDSVLIGVADFQVKLPS